MISKFKIMIMISKTQPGFVYPFTDRIQLSCQQPEVFNRSESRIKPWPGNITLTQRIVLLLCIDQHTASLHQQAYRKYFVKS